MSQANVELVRSIHAAWTRGDYRSTDWAHPEIEYVIADGPTPGSWKGPAGMAKAWLPFLDAWDEYRFEVEEYRDLDAERVLALVHLRGRGKTSGLDLEETSARGAGLFHIQHGKVTRLVTYFDRERALADLRLEG